MKSVNGKMDSDEEDMDQDTPESDKSDSRSSHSGSGSDEESSELDELECDRRRNDCMEAMSDLESQFAELKEQLYKEKLTQVIEKLQEVETGVAAEYVNPLTQLEDNKKMRLSVADIRSQLKQKNIDNISKAEEQAALQNYESEKQLVYDDLLEDLYDKIRRLEEDRHNVDISSDLFSESRTLRKRRQNNLTASSVERRRKPVSVSGPYVVYMLREAEIREDWAAIMIAVKQAEEIHRRLDNVGGVGQRCTDGESLHPYSARYSDGKLVYEGIQYDVGQRIFIETRNNPAVQAKITVITDKAVTVRQPDGSDSRLFVNQLQLGKYTIRHAV